MEETTVCHLNEQQKAKRGEILQSMFDQYIKDHSWMTYDEAAYQFTKMLDNDPGKVKIINALAASCTI